MTFDEWWKYWRPSIYEVGGLASPNQIKQLFKDCYLEGYEAGHEKMFSSRNTEEWHND